MVNSLRISLIGGSVVEKDSSGARSRPARLSTAACCDCARSAYVARVAARLIAEGQQHREAGRARQAFRCFDNAVRADPTRSWARRRAEELRPAAFGWDGPTLESDDEDRRLERD